MRNIYTSTPNIYGALVKAVVPEKEDYFMEVTIEGNRTTVLDVTSEQMEAMMEAEKLSAYTDIIRRCIVVKEEGGKFSYYLIPEEAKINWTPRVEILGIEEEIVFS